MSDKLNNILKQINESTKLGDIRKIAKEIKMDHEFALDLWSTEKYFARMLALLIMDKKQLNEELLNKFNRDMMMHSREERNNLLDWLLANQLTKDKKLINILESWQNSPSPLQKRAYWFYQARLRWTGKQIENTEELIKCLEENFIKEEPEVQWAMNLTAGWIAVYNEQYRNRIIKLGKETGLYKDEKVSRGCTPNYLPEFIRIEVEKRKYF